MLQITRRGRLEDVAPLTLAEDQALRRAFGRMSRPSDRAAGVAVVRDYQHRGTGHWFICDCLDPGVRPPALIPVAEAHVRRHAEEPWPEHASWCDFYRDPIEQQLITASYRRPPRAERLSLVTSFRSGENYVPRFGCRSIHRRRSALATLMMRLIQNADLSWLPAHDPVPRLGVQFARVRQAARSIDLEEGVPLHTFLCTYPPALPELIARLEATPPSRFRRTSRPHGLLLAVVSDASLGEVRPFQGEPVHVAGEITVFAEEDGHHRMRHENGPLARSPYLAACLIGRRHPDTPVEVLRAHLHPCVGPGHILPVDSDLERHTLRVLRRLQSWLLERLGIAIAIEKPLFDVGGYGGAGEVGSREPCIPDFILRTDKPLGSGHPIVLVETMGYADPAYRARKEVMHALMSEVLGGAPVVQHDFHFPDQETQEDRDRRFWRTVRWTVTGPEDLSPRRERSDSRICAMSAPRNE